MDDAKPRTHVTRPSKPPPDDTTQEDTVYNFDVRTYHEGQARLVVASHELIYYVGRFIHHGKTPVRKSKRNAVQFDWPLCSFSIQFTGSRRVGLRLKGKGNYFNIFLDQKIIGILKANDRATCCEVTSNLNPDQMYKLTISKRTEPQMRGAISTFKVCTFYGFLLDIGSQVVTYGDQKQRSIEFIGNSDTCGFGNEGPRTSSTDIFHMKGRTENVYNGYAAIVARMFDAEALILAWTGKGVHSNALDWGPTMADLWTRTLGSRSRRHFQPPPEFDDHSVVVPDLVVIHLGGNDLLPPISSESDIVGAYTKLINAVRLARPAAHIVCVVGDESCITTMSDETLNGRQHLSLQLQEIVKVAMSQVVTQDKLHYVYVQMKDGLCREDFGSMMHYAVSGHVKFATELAKHISVRTGWAIDTPAQVMDYPAREQDIIVPVESGLIKQCSIS